MLVTFTTNAYADITLFGDVTRPFHSSGGVRQSP
jgi:hypothetical protein